VVTVWKREIEAPEVRDQGYLRLLQTRSPGETFRGEQSAFKAQVSTLLTLLPPPVLRCRQFTVAGKHLTVLKGKQGCRLQPPGATRELIGCSSSGQAGGC
ncbi:hypothetical protein G5576_112869, partial [Homo sapiens]